MARAPATAGVGDIVTQAARRRTFAIVSHPDAGKTTTTERERGASAVRDPLGERLVSGGAA